jgi:hypothetical protein
VAKVGTSKAGGTISQQAVVHPWLAADAHGNKQTNKDPVDCTDLSFSTCCWPRCNRTNVNTSTVIIHLKHSRSEHWLEFSSKRN